MAGKGWGGWRGAQSLAANEVCDYAPTIPLLICEGLCFAFLCEASPQPFPNKSKGQVETKKGVFRIVE